MTEPAKKPGKGEWVLRLSFNVPMTAVAKARPRVTLNGTYTPKKTRDAEKTVRDYAFAAMHPRKPTEHAVILTARFIFPTPTSWPKAKRKDAFEKRLLHTQRPDLDNLMKLIKDAMIGVVFIDDAQIVSTVAHKNWGGVGRIEIEVSDVVPAELFE